MVLSGRLRGAVALAGMIGVAVGGQAGTRVVERGETLSGVARSVGVAVDDLARANGITDVHRVRAGQRLVVPGPAAPPATAAAAVVAPATVEVARGQTLSALARSLGVGVDELARANGIRNVHRVRAGRRLVVPATATATPAAVVAPAPAPPHRAVEVGRGQTLSAVARSVGVTVDELARANGIRDVHRVRAGQRLVVPAGATSASSVPDALRARPDRLVLLPLFDAAARDFGIPVDLFKAMTWQESGWRNDRVSSTNALGIGQLMPATIAFVNGVLLKAQLDPNRPEDNIRMSARFLAYLLHQNAGDVPRALASYYQGLASVRSRGPLPETVRYVANVLALRHKF
ncbi:MAG TPA: LysM peptidoglycan-binding domain-containing protein [Acidimicrobiales bacterium]|nr:LysM peptidoglycan-binding domain-containing protein [Acidimicrobiales bacterium]